MTGGVGGAKLALGLTHVLKPNEVQFLVNVGDDFEHLGLPISPDIDTLLYTLSGLSDQVQGWGRAGESWSTMEALEHLGGETWFRLGDKDIALHLLRRSLFDSGMSLTQVVEHVARQFGISHTILPVSDDPIRTVVQCELGDLPFQEYFVRHQCEPKVTSFSFDGADNAKLNKKLVLDKVSGVILCPSNPYLSIDPMLSLRELRDFLINTEVPVVAVSPIVGGKAMKGPTAKIMRELEIPSTSLNVAEHFSGLLDGFVIDAIDRKETQRIQNNALQVLVCNTVMNSLEDRIQLAECTVQFLRSLG